MATTSETRYCLKCNKTMNIAEFYQSNNTEKYPEHYLNLCKKCLTMHLDNWDSNTFLWILQDIDVPWIPDEWNRLMATYAKDGRKVTGTTILGRYLSKMKLKQFKDFRWKDTEFLQELNKTKIEEAMKLQGYQAAEIAQATARASFEVPQGELAPPPLIEEPEEDNSPPPENLYQGEDYFAEQAQETYDDLDLTDEDRTYLRLKWGKTYRPDEWVRLEQLYNEMMDSYDIESAGHIDTLKLVCKTSLKCNQLIDIGD